MGAMVAATLQDFKLQDYGLPAALSRCYPTAMQPLQEIIVAWMRGVMEKKEWSARRWSMAAKEAGVPVAETTITRSMKPEYTGVTSIPILKRLALAAGVDPPELTSMQDSRPTIPLPTRESLKAMIQVHSQRVRNGRLVDAQLAEDLAAWMHASLANLQGDPDAAFVPEAARSAARLLTVESDEPKPVGEDG